MSAVPTRPMRAQTHLKRCRTFSLLVWITFNCITAFAQISTPDDRYKADILVVVAHPDDDTIASSYLARAIFDQHKRVAVVYCTRGDSGSNSAGREHAKALGLVREIEGRKALAKLGISNVWFLDGRDTASQDVLLSLASWPSASVLEQVVRIVRLTRPEVVFTWLPSSVAGENHGDHQAAGVIATEAFDMAADPTAFPSQLVPPIHQFENAFEGLTPWQAQKLYYFTDAFDTAFFKGHGPEYDGNQISSSRKVSYLQPAAQSAAAYYTQLPDPKIGRKIEGGDTSPAAIADLQKAGYLPEPVRLWLGTSHVPSPAAGDVFQGVSSTPIAFAPPEGPPAHSVGKVDGEFGGPFGFYRNFWRAHELKSLETLRPEIAVQPRDILTIPIVINNSTEAPVEVNASAELPPGWTSASAIPATSVSPHSQSTLMVRAIAPAQLSSSFSEIKIRAESQGKTVFQDSVFVQVSAYVAGQVK
ncbi:MAG TPA: PIG-L family deacetylase [Terriglobales bacterium]|nr:PIG-L family deacetylase [Terriglobales bacterium]